MLVVTIKDGLSEEDLDDVINRISDIDNVIAVHITKESVNNKECGVLASNSLTKADYESIRQVIMHNSATSEIDDKWCIEYDVGLATYSVTRRNRVGHLTFLSIYHLYDHIRDYYHNADVRANHWATKLAEVEDET